MRHTMTLGKTAHITAARCVICGHHTPSGSISAIDHDLRGIVCCRCTPHLSLSEITLSTTPGIRQPTDTDHPPTQ